MAERSSARTDLKILLQSVLALAVIVVAGYFGATMLGPEVANLQPDTLGQPTLPVYQPSDGSEAGATPPAAAAAQPDSAQALADETTTAMADMGSQAAAGGGEPPLPGARLTAIAQGTPVPPGDRPGGQPPGGPEGGNADVRLTAIAQGTMLPGRQPGGGSDEGSTSVQARLTAIAQGTFQPPVDTPSPAEPVATPESITPLTPEAAATSAPESATRAATAVSVPGTATATAVAGDGGGAGGGIDLGGLQSQASRLFAVARGAGAKLYDRPDGDVVGELVAGSALSALARSDDGLWTLVQSNENAGWIPLDELVLFGAESLPRLSEIETTAILPSAGQTGMDQPLAPATGPSAIASPAASSPASTPSTTAPVLGEYIEPVLATIASQNNRLNVRTGPSTEFEILERVNAGEEFVVLARSALGDWIQIALPETEEGAGWVSTAFVNLSGLLDTLPVSGASGATQAPAALPTPTASASTSALSTPQTAGGATLAANVSGLPAIREGAPEVASLVLRTGPGEDFGVEKEVDAGLEFVELGRSDDGDWARIALLEAPGGVGWVDAKLLERIAPALPSSTSSTGSAETESGENTQDSTASALGSYEVAPEVAAAGAAGAVAFPEPIIATVAPDGVRINVRAGPGVDFDVVEELDPGTLFAVLAQSADGEWLEIMLPDAEQGSGWLAAGSVTLSGQEDALAGLDAQGSTESLPSSATNSAAPSPAAGAPVDPLQAVMATVVSDDAFLNVRSGPGTRFDVVDKVEPGAVIAVLARSAVGDWIEVGLGGMDVSGAANSGWVASEFVELNAPLDMLPVSAEDAEAPVSSTTSDLDHVEMSGVAEADALGPPRFLPVVGDASATDSAADLGGTLVFEASNGGQVYGYSLDTGELWTITTGFDPAISPDGRTVAFTRDGGDNGLYLVDIDGGNERLVFSGGQRLASPKWSPDGDRIVFSYGADAYECIPVGRGCIPLDEWGDLSLPDGVAPITWVNYLLAVVDANGGNYHDLATLETARAPDWNEAGIVYQSDAGLQRTADEPHATSQLILQDQLKPYFHDPDWQPGGGTIVYQGKEASHWEIFATNADGSGVRALTRPKTALVEVLPSNVSPAWSPDGTSIVFLSNRTESGEAGEWRLWVMDAGGGNQRVLPVYTPISYTFGDEQMVSWGPRS